MESNHGNLSIHIYNTEETSVRVFESGGVMHAQIDFGHNAGEVYVSTGEQAQHIASLFAQAAAALTRSEREAEADAKGSPEFTRPMGVTS